MLFKFLRNILTCRRVVNVYIHIQRTSSVLVSVIEPTIAHKLCCARCNVAFAERVVGETVTTCGNTTGD